MLRTKQLIKTEISIFRVHLYKCYNNVFIYLFICWFVGLFVALFIYLFMCMYVVFWGCERVSGGGEIFLSLSYIHIILASCIDVSI